MAKKKGNNYIIDEKNNIVRVELNRTNAESIWTVIDLDDLERALIKFPYTWYAKLNKSMGKYYAYASEYIPELKRARPIFLHQFIMEANGKTVDHKNNDCLDNRKENLRIVLDTNNSKNRRGRNSNNKSGYRNVSWSNTEKMWIVQLQINKKNTVLGKFSYDELEQAGKFAEEMRQKYYGEFAGGN